MVPYTPNTGIPPSHFFTMLENRFFRNSQHIQNIGSPLNINDCARIYTLFSRVHPPSKRVCKETSSGKTRRTSSWVTRAKLSMKVTVYNKQIEKHFKFINMRTYTCFRNTSERLIFLQSPFYIFGTSNIIYLSNFTKCSFHNSFCRHFKWSRQALTHMENLFK